MAQVNLYVDGLNLYNGALRHTPYRWLDLRKLGQALLKPDDVVQRIRYFTTRLDASDDPTVSRRQQTYIRALRTIPGLTLIHYGTFVTHARRMPRANGRGTVEYCGPTRKDPMSPWLKLALLLDAGAGDFDKALVVSNDNDFAFPVLAVRDRLGLIIGVSCPVARPGRRPARLLVNAASFTSHITSNRRGCCAPVSSPIPSLT